MKKRLLTYFAIFIPLNIITLILIINEVTPIIQLILFAILISFSIIIAKEMKEMINKDEKNN